MRFAAAGWVGILALAAALSSMSSVRAEGWRWPAQLSLAGLSVIRVQGNVNADGSGAASGILQTRGLIPNVDIALLRSTKGEITGRGSITGRFAGIELQGELTLSKDSGSGAGKAKVGPLCFPIALSAYGNTLVFSGSLPAQCELDTTLALYKFNGTLNIEGSLGRAAVTASGQVRRSGKLSGQVTDHRVSDIPLNLQEGTATANVGGVAVKFKFF